MQRQMSYDLDGTFSTRNAGELQHVQVAKTKVTRVAGLSQHRGHTAGRGPVRKYLDPSIAAKLPSPVTAPLFESRVRRIATPKTKSLNLPIGTPARDLGAYDMGDDVRYQVGALSIPGLGPITTTGWVLAGVGLFVGVVAARLIRR